MTKYSNNSLAAAREDLEEFEGQLADLVAEQDAFRRRLGAYLFNGLPINVRQDMARQRRELEGEVAAAKATIEAAEAWVARSR